MHLLVIFLVLKNVAYLFLKICVSKISARRCSYQDVLFQKTRFL